MSRAESVHSIAICDDAPAFRQALRLVLSRHPKLEVVAEAENGREAIEIAAVAKPDVLLLDVSMPVLDGIAALPQVLAASPSTKVLMISAFESPDTKARAREAGAAGFVEKGTRAPDLIDAIRSVLRASG